MKCKEKNLQDSFYDFVFNKISFDKRERFVEKNGDSIDITPYNSEGVKVVPVWKHLNVEDLDIQDDMERAAEIILESESKCVYFVYPKNDNFKKHIQIKIPELEEMYANDYMIKVVPYSLHDKIKQGS
ncbi:MAG: hypothetical protein OIF32_04250 [Campylobacterales bacterium]|nr:hypothetical protein [Campylobacterales bacterium]